MSALTNRISRLESQAAKRVRPAGSWATYWQSLRKVYGDGGTYSAEELAELDQRDPASEIDEALDKVYGRRGNESQKPR